MGRPLSRAFSMARKFAGTPAGQFATAKFKTLLSEAVGKRTQRLTASAALKGTKLKSYLDRTYQRKCGVEVKHYENQAAGLAVGTNLLQVEQYPNNAIIAQGLTDGTRVGNSVEVKKLALNMTFYTSPGAINSTRVRAILVRCHEANAGTTPAPSNILWATGNIRSGFVDRDENIVPPTVPFTVLKTWDFLIDPPATGGRDRKDIRFNYSPKKCHALRWLDTDIAGNNAALYEGAMALYVMYDGSFAPTLNTWHELQYVDL